MKRQIPYFLAALFIFTAFPGCTGPTKRGKEARDRAKIHFNAVRSRIDYDQAMQSFNRGQMVEAQKHLDIAIKKSPEDASYYVLLGRICLETSQMENAVLAFEKSTQLDDEIADPHYYLGITAERLENPDEAAMNYLAAFERDGEMAQYLTAAAEVLIAEERFAEAETILSRDASRFRNNAAIHHLRGKVSLMNGHWNRAVDSLRRAVLLDDEDQWMLEDLARAQMAAGHHSDCLQTIEQLEKYVTTEGKSAAYDPREIVRLRARCLVDARRFRDAHQVLYTFTDTYPEDVDAWIDFGLVCREVGDNRRLRKAGQRVATLERDRFEGYFLLGCSFMGEADGSDAVKFFTKAAQLAPQRKEAWMALGMAHELAGNASDAYRAYARVDTDSARALMTQVGEDLN